MRKVWCMVVVAAFGVLGAVETVRADLTNIRPVTPRMGPEEPLQSILNRVLEPNRSVLSQDNTAVFTNAGDQSAATMIIEIAGYASRNVFGLYEYGSPGHRATIFEGAAGAGATATITFETDGDVIVDRGSAGTQRFAHLFGRGTMPMFGFFISTPQGNTFFTEDSENRRTDPRGLPAPQALIYRGDDVSQIDVSGDGNPPPPETFTSDAFLIAFEDLVYANGSDQDFNDMVVMVEGIAPVPAPAAVLLGAIGLGLVGIVRRRFA